MLELALAAVAVALALTQPIPQIARLARTRSIAGVSGATTWLGFTINAGWLAYGLGRGSLFVTTVSAVYVAGYAIIGVQLVRRGNRWGIGPASFAAVALVGLAVTTGWTALGLVLSAAVGAQFLPQVAAAWRSRDLTALAPGTYLVCGMDGVVWGTYGGLVGDGPLLAYGLVMVSVAVAVLVPCLRFAMRRPAIVVAPRR